MKQLHDKKMSKKNCDLHTHSYYSDGAYSPTMLVMKAKEAGLKIVALTDHNTVGGVREAVEAGKKLGVRVIPGCEFHSSVGEILGYFIDVNDPEINRLSRLILHRVEERIKKMIEKLGTIGIKIDYAELKLKHKDVNRAPIAEAIYRQGFAKSFREAFDKYLLEGKIGYVPIKYPDPITIIKAIKNAGGAAVMAHPWLEDWKKQFEMIDELIDAGLDGMEIETGPNVLGDEENMVKEKIKKLCEEKVLIMTRGSDYHGPVHKNMIGEHNCEESVVEELKKRAGSKKS